MIDQATSLLNESAIHYMVENDTIILARNDLKESMMKLLQNDIDILTTAPIELSFGRNILGCYWKGGLKNEDNQATFHINEPHR